jgi:hypothetical protein
MPKMRFLSRVENISEEDLRGRSPGPWRWSTKGTFALPSKESLRPNEEEIFYLIS